MHQKPSLQLLLNVGFHHVSSNPHFVQTNGLSERAVKTVKSVLGKSADPYLGFFRIEQHHWNLAIRQHSSLCQDTSGQTLPVIPDQLRPTVIGCQRFKEKVEHIKTRQKRNLDSHQGARELTPLDPGNEVWIPDLQTKGTVEKDAATRSYYIDTKKGTTVRRNRRVSNQLPERRDPGKESIAKEQSTEQTTNELPTERMAIDDTTQTTKSGRLIKAPSRYIEQC